VWEKGEMYTKFWLENLKERDNLKELVMDENVILKWMGVCGLD
jgi:hypothetical protein